MEIRIAEKQDIEQIIDLCELHAEYEKAAYNKRGKAALLVDFLFNHSDVVNCFVVVEDTRIVGYATFMKQFSTWETTYYLYLDCLFLEESIRGKGIGKQLMKRIRKIAIQENCSWIEWQTPVFNKKAIAFYNKIGAKAKSKERFFWLSQPENKS